MKIAISGAHGQGKTTILNSLKSLPEFKDFTFVNSPTRALQDSFKINENGTQDTQISIMYKHYMNVMTCESNTIFDRCALDGMAYTMYFIPKINISVMESMRIMYAYLMQQYDYIFYVIPELSPTCDGTRSVDVSFFEAIKSNFNVMIKSGQYKINTLSGTNEQRINTILNTIYK